MIFAARRRLPALVCAFLILFAVAVSLQALVVLPLLAVEEGPRAAGELLVRSWEIVLPVRGGVSEALQLAAVAAVIAATQVAFIAPLVGRPAAEGGGRSLRASVIAAIVMAMFLSGGLLIALLQCALLLAAGAGASSSFDQLELLGGDGVVSMVVVLAWLAMGVGWFALLWSAGRSRDPNRLALFVRWILAGTAVELALSIPLYALARRNESCYCSLPSFWSILVGTTALFWLCGPWAVLFVTREFRRNWSREACGHCGYPRRSGASVCSECGRAH